MTHHLATTRPRPRRAFTLVELVIVIGLILLLVAITVSVSVGVLRQSEVRETQNVLTILDNALQEWQLHDRDGLTYGRGANHGFGNGEPCGDSQRQFTYRLPQRHPAGAQNGWGGDEQTVRNEAMRETDLLIALLLRRPVFEDMITSIDSRFMRRIDIDDPPDDLTANNEPDLSHFDELDAFSDTEYIYRFRDAWDRPIVAIHPGREFVRRCRNGTMDPDSGYCVGSGANERCADDDGTIRTPLENVFGVAESRRIYFTSAGSSERFGNLRLDLPSGGLSDAQKQQADRAGDNIYSYPVQTDQARPQ